ncbi:MAG: carboxypeptidase-like regulatory domain-containing protein [Bryobacteraceae bacterium]
MRFLLALLAIPALAQPYEIYGSVIEQGLNIGLPGVQVILTEFVPNNNTLDAKVFATAFTDAAGNFSFKPTHIGDFRLNIQKPGYVPSGNFVRARNPDSIEEFVVLTTQRPSQEWRFTLMQPASLTGRVVDDEDQPIPNLPLRVVSPDMVAGDAGIDVTTAADGTFTAKNVPPGPYIVRVLSDAVDRNKHLIDYTEDDAKIIDEDYESTYWPGGTTNPRTALPLNISPASSGDIGTIKVRRVKYFRTHLSVEGPCAAGRKLELMVRIEGDPGTNALFNTPMACGNEFILRYFRPGAYNLSLYARSLSAKGEYENDTVWASALLVLKDETSRLSMTLASGTDIPGRLIAVQGTKLPASKNLSLVLWVDPPTSGQLNNIARIDPNGSFIARSIPFRTHRVGMDVPATHYIKEVRYGGVPIPDGRITLAAGAELEFLIDEQPASVSGTVALNDKPVAIGAVFLVKQSVTGPGMAQMNAPYSFRAPVQNGQFQIGSLPPGDYRIGSIAIDLLRSPNEADFRQRVASQGERITLQRGEQKIIQLKAAQR